MDCASDRMDSLCQHHCQEKSLRKRSFANLLKVFLTDYYQKKDEHRVGKDI